MLIQQLRELEEDGIVDRAAPPRVEYRLTDLGRELNTALESLGVWGQQRIDRIGSARVHLTARTGYLGYLTIGTCAHRPVCATPPA